MKLTPLTDKEIRIGKAAPREKQTPISEIAGGAFEGKCPLWTYVLAEAMQNVAELQVPATGAPDTVSTPQLGPVGGRIAAETFLALIYADKLSFLRQHPEWKPYGAHFGLRELVMYAVGDGSATLTPRVLLSHEGDPLHPHRPAA